jgi:hypothetical protein
LAGHLEGARRATRQDNFSEPDFPTAPCTEGNEPSVRRKFDVARIAEFQGRDGLQLGRVVEAESILLHRSDEIAVGAPGNRVAIRAQSTSHGRDDAFSSQVDNFDAVTPGSSVAPYHGRAAFGVIESSGLYPVDIEFETVQGQL